MQVHLVSKSNFTEHELVDVEHDLGPLKQSSVRVQIHSIVFTSNTYTYAAKGSLLGFWNIYPIPVSPSIELQDPGIVPTWGVATVIESTIDPLPPGLLLFGVLPVSPHLFDLELSREESSGHWLEVSEYRKPFWNTVKRYVEYSAQEAAEGYSLICKILLEPAYLLNTYVFPSDSARSAIHPLRPGSIKWSRDDGDLSKVVVVILSASSKTGKALSWHIQCNRKVKPLALIEVASEPTKLPAYSQETIPRLAVTYADLVSAETLDWIKSLMPQRVVMFDIGAPAATLIAVTKVLTEPSLPFTVIGIGGRAESQPATVPKNVPKILFNTSDVRDYAISLEGARQHFAAVDDAYGRFVRDGGIADLSIDWGFGIDGLYEAWAELSRGEISSSKFKVVKL